MTISSYGRKKGLCTLTVNFILNSELAVWNPESKTVLDSLSYGARPRGNCDSVSIRRFENSALS